MTEKMQNAAKTVKEKKPQKNRDAAKTVSDRILREKDDAAGRTDGKRSGRPVYESKTGVRKKNEDRQKNPGVKIRNDSRPDRKPDNYTGQKLTDQKNTGKEKFNSADKKRKEESGAGNKKQGLFCPADKKCGGCRYLKVSYEEQLKLKRERVAKLLKPYCKVDPVVGMEQPLYYRNKVHAVFDRTRDGKVISGIYQEGTHSVVPVDNCLIENEKADAIIRDIRGMLKSFKIKTYDEDTGYGLLRHVLVRTGHKTGQIMVVLVLGSPILPSKNNFVRALRELHPEITTIIINVNDRQTSMVLGDKESVIYGKGYIEDELCGYTFRISSKSFYQVNSVQTELLYRKAVELAGLTGKERVIDAYCGIGTIGIVASPRAGEVISVELNGDAVHDAVRNAARNGIKNISFYQNDAGNFLTEMAEDGEKADVVFMDPPRQGSSEEFLASVITLAPRKIIYISCNPESLARDLKYLTGHGYQAQGAWPYDMFPFTEEIETVCCLSSRKPDAKMRSAAVRE